MEWKLIHIYFGKFSEFGNLNTGLCYIAENIYILVTFGPIGHSHRYSQNHTEMLRVRGLTKPLVHYADKHRTSKDFNFIIPQIFVFELEAFVTIDYLQTNV